MRLDIRDARNSDEIDAALDLRRAVFCGEQGVPEDEEIDGRDDEAQHLVAVQGDRVVATCRLLHEGAVTKLGRMAVAPEARRRGIATRLLQAADAAARARGSARIVLHAQTDARALYAADGYVERGDVFLEAGIEHVTMEKAVGPRTGDPRA
jgi:predicted GNAT family N-acyltransferase